MALTAKQQLFIEAYLGNGLNATQAAITAGYSPRTARSQGQRMLTFVDIESEISRRLAKKVMSADEALEAMSEMSHSDLDDFMSIPGTFPYFDYQKARELGKTHLIKKIKVRGDGGIEVELYNRQRATETMMRHHGLLKDGHTINISIELIVQTVDALTKAGIDVQEFFEKAKQRAEQLGFIQPG